MITCPNKNDKDFKELESVLGDSATFMWSENGGNPFHLDKEGKPSKLFSDLVRATGSKREAIEIKAKTFTEQFKDWYKGESEPSVMKKKDGSFVFYSYSGLEDSPTFYVNNTNQPLKEYIASEKTIRELAAKMADRIGLKVKYESDRSSKYKGKLKGDTAIINLAYATLDTPIHEILGHPIIRSIKNNTTTTVSGTPKPLDSIQNFTVGNVTYKKINSEWHSKIEDPNAPFPTEFRKANTDFVKSAYEVYSDSEINYNTESKLYKNLLKELETGGGKEILDGIKKDYIIKENEENYTLEEQQEEAIVELLGLYTAGRLDAVKDGKLISLLKRLLKEMKSFMRLLIGQKEVEIDKLPDNMSIGEIADLLAYSNSKLILPDNEVKYTTPDNKTFKTYQEASNHVSELSKIKEINVDDLENEGVVSKAKDIPVDNFASSLTGLDVDLFIKVNDKWYVERYLGKKPVSDEDVVNAWNDKEKYVFSQEDGAEWWEPQEGVLDTSLTSFIERNKEYEQSKEIIEKWKKVNNIKYDPEEVYSRGQGFYSVVSAYSDFDVELMLQNLLTHIEDNKKAGGTFAISAFTKPIDKKINHLEGGGGKIKFKIFPKSDDINWASNIDVFSGSVWDASSKFSKDKESEIIGVSYTKSPALSNVESVQPNLASIIDDLSHYHNELGIELTDNNFRLEYDKDIPYSTKKILDSVNNILDEKYGKLVEPKIGFTKENKARRKEIRAKIDLLDINGVVGGLSNEEQAEYDKLSAEYNELTAFKQPIQTKDSLKESIESIKNKTQGNEYTNQAEINTKVAALKEGQRKFPRSLIRSEVIKSNNSLSSDPFGQDELPFQKVKSINNSGTFSSTKDAPHRKRVADSHRVKFEIIPDEATKWLEERDLSVSFYKETKRIGNKIKHGYFTNGAIHLWENADAGTEFHEAFHAVFRTYLDADRQNVIFDEARKLYGKDLSEEQLEERLSDDFSEYVMTKGKLSPLGKVGKFFKDLYHYIKAIITKKPNVSDLYSIIESNRLTTVRKGLPFKKGVSKFSNDSTANSAKTGLTEQQVSDVIDTIIQVSAEANKLLKKTDNKIPISKILQNARQMFMDKALMNGDGEAIIDKDMQKAAREKYRESLNGKLTGEEFEDWEVENDIEFYAEEVFEGQDLDDTRVNSFQYISIYENWENLTDEYLNIEEKGWDNLAKRELNKGFKLSLLLDDENLDTDEQERIFELDSKHVSQKNSLNSDIKSFLSTIESKERNFMGYKKYIPFDELYGNMVLTLANSYDLQEMEKRLIQQSNAKPYYSEVVKAFNKLDSNMKAKFFNSFNMTYGEFKTVKQELVNTGRKNSNGKDIWRVQTRLFDSNQKKADKILLNRYRNSSIEEPNTTDDKAFFSIEKIVKNQESIDVFFPKENKAKQYMSTYKLLQKELVSKKGDLNKVKDLFTEMNNLLGASFTREHLDKYIDGGVTLDGENLTGIPAIKKLAQGTKFVGIHSIANAIGETTFGKKGAIESFKYTGEPLKNDVYSEFSSYFKDIVKIEATNTNENFDSFIDAMGKSIYPIQLQTNISEMVNIFKSGKTDDILQLSKDVTFVPNGKENDPRYHDIWFSMLNNDSFRNSINVFDLDAYQKVSEDVARSDYSNMNEVITLTTRLELFLNNGNNKTNLVLPTLSDRGRMVVMSLPRLEGKGGLLANTGSNFNDLIRNYILQDILRLQRANKAVMSQEEGGLAEDDLIENYHYIIDRSKGETPNNKNKRDKSGSVFKLGIANQLSMLKDSTIIIGSKSKKLSELSMEDFGKMKSSEITKVFEEQIQEVNKYIENETTRLLDDLLKLDIISGQKLEDGSYRFTDQFGTRVNNIANLNTSLDPKSIASLSKGANSIENGVRTILKGFVKENLVGNIQFTKYFMGDQAFAKKGSKEDAAKRVGASGTPGTKFLMQGMIKSDPTFGLPTKYNDSIIYDIYNNNTDKNISESIRKTLKGIGHEQADEIADNYKVGKSNKTDAQGWMSIDFYRNHQQGLGAWTKKHEQAYKNYKGGGEFRDDSGEAIIISPIKDNHYGMQYNENTGMVEPIMIKNSYMVLLREFTKDHDKFDDIRKRMELEEEYSKGGVKNQKGLLEAIHTVNTDSTRKLARNGIMDLNEEWYDLANMKVNKINSYWLRVPQVIPNDHRKPLWGSQLRKNILSSLGRYFNDSNYSIANDSNNQMDNLTGENIFDLYQAVGSQMIEVDKNELYGELHLDKFLETKRKFDKSTTQVDKEKYQNAQFELLKSLRDTLIEQNEERDLPDNYNKALKIIKTVDGWDYATPLSFPAFQRKFEQIIHSLFRNNIINQKINGGTAVQLAELGGLLVDEKQKDGTTKKVPVDLKFVTTEGKTQNANYDKIKHAEVAIGSELAAAYNLKPGDNLDKIPLELRKMIIYRIPNQGKNSTLPVVIKYVLPENYSHAIVVPGQITTQQGSDFDIDKVFIMQPNYKVVSKSGQEKYNFISKHLKSNSNYIKSASSKKFKNLVDEVDKQDWDELDNDLDKSVKKALIEFRKLGNIEYEKIKADYKSILLKDGTINQSHLEGLNHEELENIMTDLYESILTNPNHLAELVTPLEDPELSDLSKVMKEKLGLGNPLDRNAYDVEAQIQLRNQAGKMGVALWANALSGHNVMQFGDFTANKLYGFTYTDNENENNFIQGNISTNSRGLLAVLTNPTELAKNKRNLNKSYPIKYKGIEYKDVEEAYQELKNSAESYTRPKQDDSLNYGLMIGLIKTKLETYPEIVSAVQNKGGINWLINQIHQPTKQNTIWESNGGNWFMEALSEAYGKVTGEVLESKSKVKELTNLSIINDITGTGKEISTNISNRLNISVDNAKDPIMYFLNDNSFTYPVINYLLRLGVDNTTVSNIMSQPIIRELTEEYQNRGYTPDKLYDLVTEIGNKYTKSHEISKVVKPININSLSKTIGKSVKEDTRRQLEMLNNFYLWSKAGRDLMKVDKMVNSDRIGDMSSISAIQAFEDVENYVLNTQNSINGLSEFRNNKSYPIANKWRSVISDTMDFSSKLFPFNVAGVSFVKDNIKTILHKEQLNKAQHDSINRASMLHILANTELRDVFTKQRVNELLLGDNHIARKFENLVEEIPLLKKNDFLKMISPDSKNVDSANLIKRIKFENSYSYSRAEKEGFTDGILQMMQKPGLFTDSKTEQQKIIDFVDDLVAYNLLSYGVNSGAGSFFDLIPIEYWTEKNITQDYRKEVENLKNKDYLFKDSFIEKYIRDNWYEKGLIKTITPSKLERNSGMYSPKNDTHLTPSNSSKILSDGFNTLLGYYKIKDKTSKTELLYKLAGVIDGNAVYDRVQVAGEMYKFKEQNIKDKVDGEYQSLSESVHPDNADTGKGIEFSSEYYANNFDIGSDSTEHETKCKVIKQ